MKALCKKAFLFIYLGRKVGTHNGNSVQDVEKGGQDLSVEVGGDEGTNG